MTFTVENLERWTAAEEYAVTTGAVAAFEAATNDTADPHEEGAGPAPPTFAVVPALPCALAAIREVWPLDRDGYDTRAVHGEHRIEFEAPLLPGMTVVTRAATVGIVPKSTGSLLITQTETRDGRTDVLLNRMWFVNYLRDVDAGQGWGVQSPLARADETGVGRHVAAIPDRVDPDQSLRYAEAAGDFGPYHINEDVARAAGFQGVIVHGLCLLAFAARALVSACCEGDRARLKCIEARFSAPLYPGKTITTSIWESQDAYYFAVADPDGTTVLTRGRAEVLP